MIIIIIISCRKSYSNHVAGLAATKNLHGTCKLFIYIRKKCFDVFYQVDLFVGYFSYLSTIHSMQSANPSSILCQIYCLYFVLAV